MKTIQELNERIWYRFLKVTIILITIIIGGFSFAVIWSSYQPIFDNIESYVKCDNGKTIGLDENNITLYSDYIFSEDDKKLKTACGSGSKFDQYLINKNYQLISVYKSRNWGEIIKYSLFVILCTILTLETIKRIFYYIVLGSLKPKKRKENLEQGNNIVK